MWRKLMLGLTMFAVAMTATLAASDVERGFKTERGSQIPEEAKKALETVLAERDQAPKVVILQFINSRSRQSMDSLAAVERNVAEPLEGRNVAIVAIAVRDSEENVEKILAEHELSFPLIPDPDREVFDHFARDGVPRTVIVDAEGTILFQHAGWRPGREADYRVVARATLAGERLPEDLFDQNRGIGRPNPQLNARDIRGMEAPELPVEAWVNEPPEDTQGKYILVDFWATWCGPCISTLNVAEELHDQFEDKVISKAVSDEPIARVRPFVEQRGWKQPIGTDSQGRTKKALQVRAIPHGYLVNPDGIVVWQGHPMELWGNDAAGLKRILAQAESGD